MDEKQGYAPAWSDPTKETELTHRESIHDKELLGTNGLEHGAGGEESGYGKFSEEERMHEKKLRKKIDGTIMPLVVLVSRALEGFNEMKSY